MVTNGGTPISRSDAISKRVSRLGKKMKLQNPTHLYAFSLASAFSVISTTGTLFNPANSIEQGDNYNNRFGASIFATRLTIRGILHAGGSATTSSDVRISVVRAASNASFAANMSGTYSPIAVNSITQLLFDRFYDIPPSQAANGFPVNVNINLKLRHKQKFSGSGTSTAVGDCIVVVCQSSAASGGNLNPFWGTGTMEYYFQPL